jgi:hypothetical protein
MSSPLAWLSSCCAGQFPRCGYHLLDLRDSLRASSARLQACTLCLGRDLRSARLLPALMSHLILTEISAGARSRSEPTQSPWAMIRCPAGSHPKRCTVPSPRSDFAFAQIFCVRADVLSSLISARAPSSLMPCCSSFGHALLFISLLDSALCRHHCILLSRQWIPFKSKGWINYSCALAHASLPDGFLPGFGRMNNCFMHWTSRSPVAV